MNKTNPEKTAGRGFWVETLCYFAGAAAGWLCHMCSL